MADPVYIGSLVSGIRTGGYTAVSGTYTVLSTDSLIDCTSGTFTATLPTAVGIAGREYVIKNSGVGVITVEGNGSETIDGALNLTLVAGESLFIASNGANWIVL